MNQNWIPASHADLLRDETKAFAYLATIMPDGSPQLTPLWFNVDEEHILINSAQGRVKDRNMRRYPRVAIVIQDPHNAYRYLQVRGQVVAITTEGASDHIDYLAGKYTGTPKYKYPTPDQVRVTYKILPEKIDAHG